MKDIPEQSLNELTNFLTAIGEPFDKIWLRFWDWHLLHPDVEVALKELALKAHVAGLKVYGIGAIWEVLRWHLRIVNGRTEEFKCCNDYRSRYARFLMWRYPELKGFFTLRDLRAAKGDA
jgi:hypothetical protein